MHSSASLLTYEILYNKYKNYQWVHQIIVNRLSCHAEVMHHDVDAATL